MVESRLIPCLLLTDDGFVKTTRFKDRKYIGDPINTVKILNDLEVDELIILDIDATKKRRKPNFDTISQIVSEAFMPVSYGGGIRSVEDAERLFYVGVEKITLTTGAIMKPSLISEIAKTYGSQSITVGIDVKKQWLGRRHVYVDCGRQKLSVSPRDIALNAVDQGAGEILVHSIDRDGRMCGYDLDLIRELSSAVEVPLIACGGAGSLFDTNLALNAGASAAAAGSLFVYDGPHKAVLVSYPKWDERPE